MTRGAAPSTAGFSAVEVTWDDPEAVRLRDAFDLEMASRYGDDASATDTGAVRLASAFAIDREALLACVLLRADDGRGPAAAHGALFDRPDLGAVELRKVVVDPSFRGRRLGHRIMAELETRAAARGARRLVLDTGPRQPDAIALYVARGYTRVAVFAPYTAIPRAICFEKRVDAEGGAAAAG